MATTEQDERRWALEQAIKLHAANGVATNVILDEAEKLLKFVRTDDTKIPDHQPLPTALKSRDVPPQTVWPVPSKPFSK